MEDVQKADSRYCGERIDSTSCARCVSLAGVLQCSAHRLVWLRAVASTARQLHGNVGSYAHRYTTRARGSTDTVVRFLAGVAFSCCLDEQVLRAQGAMVVRTVTVQYL